MRQMVLNHVSLVAPNRFTAIEWLRDVASGMGALVECKASESALRMRQHFYETPCTPEVTLWDLLLLLQKQGWRDEFAFFSRLGQKVPLLTDIEEEVEDRFLSCEALGCEAINLSREDGEPLVLCAIADGIAIGFPTHPIWQKERVVVAFLEMLPDGCLEEVSEPIDNLTRSGHAKAICARYREELRQLVNPAQLWSAREIAFPALMFGPKVEGHLAALDRSCIQTVANKLASLDEAASQWPEVGGPAPRWTCKVTDESASVHQSPKLREARRFQSHVGERALFTWHARYGSGGRIHLRFDAATHEVEIGYVGPHLPI